MPGLSLFMGCLELPGRIFRDEIVVGRFIHRGPDQGTHFLRIGFGRASGGIIVDELL